MAFNKKFKVLEIRDDGMRITHFLSGKAKDVNQDIEMFKKASKRYEMFGEEGMVVWA